MRTGAAQGKLVGQDAPLNAETAALLEPEWRDLARCAAERNLFAYPWFVLPSLPLLAPLRPRIVTVREDGLLIGLHIVREDRGYARLPVSFLRSAHHHGQYLGVPLVRAGHEMRFARGLCNWLDAAPARQVFLKLTLLSEEGPVANAIRAACHATGRLFMDINRFERAAIALADRDRRAPDAHLSTNRRKSLRRAMHGLAQRGPTSFETLTDAAALRHWMDDFLRLDHAGWKGEGGTSILSCPLETGFYRELAANALAQGCLNFFRLKVGDTPVAYTLDLQCAPEAYCLKTAFDPAYRKHSPGVLMEYETLLHYHRHRGIGRVDSCTAPDNALLNELWPDRKAIADLAIARQGLLYQGLVLVLRRLKRAQHRERGERS